MKNSSLSIAIFAILFIGGCKSSASDEVIAKDMCGCFNMIKDSIPAEALPVFSKAAVADDPKETYSKEMQKLNPETTKKLVAALMLTTKAGSPISNCLNEMDKKYKTTEKDELVMAQRMVDALKKNKDCDIMLSLMRINLKK
ncbi:MAG: hypothetical protein IPL84_17430 [Chitinophagaceae bacterium]|nr:hypothetical protein [Chitinophagaceae bacterium]